MKKEIKCDPPLQKVITLEDNKNQLCTTFALSDSQVPSTDDIEAVIGSPERDTVPGEMANLPKSKSVCIHFNFHCLE